MAEAEFSVLAKFTEPERELLEALMPGGLISATVPANLPFPEILQHSETCVTALVKVNSYKNALLAVLGRLMSIASRDKDGLKAAGFQTMAAFTEHLEKISGKKQTDLYDSKRIWEYAGDDLTADEYVAAGITNLKLLCSHTDPTASSRQDMLEAAVNMNTKDFKRYLEETGHAGKGQTSGASYILTGNVEQITEIRSFLDSKEIRAHVGSVKPIEILLALIGDSRTGTHPWPVPEEEVKDVSSM